MDMVFLKINKEAIILPITKIVNQAIKGLFPSVWKTAIITPVFKAGNPMVVSNYRPISILPTVKMDIRTDYNKSEYILLLIASNAVWISQTSFHRNSKLLSSGKYQG